MSDDATKTRPYGGNTRAAWLATAAGIPIHVLVWAVLWGPGTQLFGSLSPNEPPLTLDNPTLAAIASINILIVLVGIWLVAHTIGRLVFARTADKPIGQAAVVFAAMAAILAVVPVVIVGIGQDHTWPAVAVAIVLVALPCIIAAGATRALLPSIDRYSALRSAILVLLVIAIVAVVVFTFFAYSG